jgi:hypothetical protein
MLLGLYKHYRHRFLLDLAFLGVLVLFLLLGLLLSLSHELVSSGEMPSSLSLATVAASPQVLPPLLGTVEDSITGFNQGTTGWLDGKGSLLIYTDPAATYNNPSVKELWAVVLAIADSTIGIFIVLAGYQIMLGGFGSRYTEALEGLPRLVSACIGANVSLLFARFWVDLNDLLCAVMLVQTANHPLSVFSVISAAAALSLIALPLLALFTLLMLILGIQMVVRLALILFLTVCLPILFILLASRHTQHIGQAGISSYIAAVMTQALQLTCITIGMKVLISFLLVNIDPASLLAPVATILAGIGLLWLTLRIPGLLRQWSLQPIAESGQAVSSLIIATFVRLVFF